MHRKEPNPSSMPGSSQRVGKVLLIDETQPDRKMAVVCDLASKFVDLVELANCRLLYAYAKGSYYDVHGEKVSIN